MEFDRYQNLSTRTLRTDDIEVLTLGLLGEAGSVASSVKKIKRDNKTPDVVQKEIATELGDTLWYLAQISSYFNLKLSHIASENLAKTLYLFTDDKRNFDARSPAGQRLPEKGDFIFRQGASDGRVQIEFEGRNLGDSLDDNAYIDDGYRFHDVFHLSYVAKLGWSPVFRKLLDAKRRYDREIDRVEDGARSIFLEEGISVFVFNQNKTSINGVSAFSDRGNIPFNIVQTIKTMTRGLEVDARSISDWFDAISSGFRCYDKLVKNGGGLIRINRKRKTIAYIAK